MVYCCMNWVPPKSPHDLIQEHYWPDEWKILVCCLLLNQTSRKQVDKIIEEFFERYPDPHAILEAGEDEMIELLRPLGMFNKRVMTLKRFSAGYLHSDWLSASDLYGCGKYANDTWRIFCQGDWYNVDPQDHALNHYHEWLKENYGSSYAA